MDHKEQILRQGELARQLLAAPFFREVIDTMLLHAAQKVLGSDPDKWKERDAAHRDYLALQRIVQTLQHMVAVAEQLTEELREGGEPEREPDLFERD